MSKPPLPAICCSLMKHPCAAIHVSLPFWASLRVVAKHHVTVSIECILLLQPPHLAVLQHSSRILMPAVISMLFQKPVLMNSILVIVYSCEVCNEYGHDECLELSGRITADDELEMSLVRLAASAHLTGKLANSWELTSSCH